MRQTSQYGVRGEEVSWGTELQLRRSRVQFPIVLIEFFFDIIPPAPLSVLESASNIIEYQKYFLGGKGGRC